MTDPSTPDTACALGRRGFLTASLAGAAGVAAAVTLPAWPARARGTTVDAAGAPVSETHPETEPSGTHVRTVDGTGVVFAYGIVMPGFEGWRHHSPERRYVSLDGAWRFAADPDASGVDKGWHRPGFDDRRWRRAEVPAAWDLLDTPGFGSLDGSDFGEGTAFLDGYAWYRREVALPAVPGGRQSRHVRLHFLAVGYSADVWLDGVYLGKHEGASSPFAMPVPTRLTRARRHVLAVRVYRRASYSAYTGPASPVTDDYEIPYKPVDYWPYAGITRSAWVEVTDEVALDKLLVSAADGRTEVRAIVSNHGSRAVDVEVSLDVPGASRTPRRRLTVGAGAVRVATFDVSTPRAPRWTPDDPRVLTARATLTVVRPGRRRVDSLATRYGMRRLAVAGDQLQLNGEQLFLKGTSWHEETAARGRAMTVAEYQTELGHVLTLGGNFIRNCVYQRHPYVYEWADEHGVFVMDDVDTMWLNTAQEQLQTEKYGLSRAMALNLAWNQHNNPSVILWGLQNESEIDGNGAPVYRAWLQDMKDAIKAVDRHDRPVTWASSTTNDPAFDIADVIGFNEYFGYFYGASSDLGPAIDSVHAAHPGKPILITENGTWSLAGNRGSASEQGTEEWQANYLSEHWAQVIERSSYVAGYTLWVLKDYKERAGYNQEYNGVSVLGLLTFDTEQPKLAYGTFRALPMPR